MARPAAGGGVDWAPTDNVAGCNAARWAHAEALQARASTHVDVSLSSALLQLHEARPCAATPLTPKRLALR